MPDAGDAAPAFEAVDQSRKTHRLSDYSGRKVALFFYPKDDTPVCTKQACNLRDNYVALQRHGVVVLGVSPDDVASHDEFAGKFDLPFPLLADPSRTILESYGVWGEKNLYGRKFMGVKRTTFLIAEDGTIRKVFRRPKVRAHAEEILAALGP